MNQMVLDRLVHVATAPSPVGECRAYPNMTSPVILVGGRPCVATVRTPSGDVIVTWRGIVSVLSAAFENDRHSTPALLHMSNGYIMVVYSKHHTGGLYMHISTNPNDPTSWGPRIDISSQTGRESFTYPHLVELSDGIYLFIRCWFDELSSAQLRPGDAVAAQYIKRAVAWCKTEDFGTTWTSLQRISQNGHVEFNVCQNGTDRVDFIFQEGVLSAIPLIASYHFYMESGGDFFQTDGTPLSVPFVSFDDMQPIIESQSDTYRSGQGHVFVDPDTGDPVLAFPMIVDSGPLADLWVAKWTGSPPAWELSLVDTTRALVAPAAPYSNFHTCMDPDDFDVCYTMVTARTDLQSGYDRAPFNIFRYRFTDGAWVQEHQITFGAVGSVQPRFIPGTRKMFFYRGIGPNEVTTNRNGSSNGTASTTEPGGMVVMDM